MKNSNSSPEIVKKIAIVRANALGDFIFSLPALSAIKNRFPEAEIVYLGNAWHQGFLEGRPGPINRVVVIPRCQGMPHESYRVENPEEVDHFFREIRNENFDIAFQMHGGGKNSNPFTLSLGARYTIGLRTSDAAYLDINIPYILYQNEYLRYLEVATAAGAEIKTLEPVIAVTTRDQKELSEKIPDLKRPYVVLHPGASDLRRRWPPEKFARVGDTLAEKGFYIYITGSGEEQEVVSKVYNTMKRPAGNLFNRLSLNGLTALMESAELLISNDTGPLHLARAVKTPTVGIYWCSNTLMSGPLTSARNRTCTVWNPSCPLCGIDCSVFDAHQAYGNCTHETSFVESVKEEEVLEKSLDLLTRTNHSQHIQTETENFLF